MRTHRHARLHFHANAVLGHAIDRLPAHRRTRHVDHLWIDARAHGFEHSFASAFCRQIDCAGSIKIERDAGLVRSNQSEHDLIDTAAGEIMCLERIARNFQASFDRRDSVIDDVAHWDFAQSHSNHLPQAHRRARDMRANPKSKKVEKDNAKDERRDRDHRDANEIK